jgi:DHA1 family bicyclomycin/chloramphenicol resistance-like MFS transporter
LSGASVAHASSKKKFSEPQYIVLLALLLGSQPVATDLYLPALPAIAAELGNPALTLTGLMLTFGFAQLILGPLSDRFGRRLVLLAGCAAYALSSFAGAWVTTLYGLVICRCLQGAAMAALVVCARASVRDLYSPLDGMRVLSRGLTGLGLVALACPLIGALLVARFSWHAAFIAVGIYAAIAGVWVWLYFDESRPDSVPMDANVVTRNATLQVLKGPRFRAWTAMLIATYGMLFCFLLSSGFVYIKVFGFSPLACGLVLAGNSVAYIAGTYVCRWLLHRMGPDLAVRNSAWFALAGAALMLVVAIAEGPQPWAMIVGQYLLALSHGVNQPCGQAGAVGDFPEHAGRAAALSGFAMMIAAFAFGQLMAPSLGRSAWPLVISNGLGSVAIAVVAWVMVPRAYAAARK